MKKFSMIAEVIAVVSLSVGAVCVSVATAASTPVAGYVDVLTRDVNRAGYANGVRGWAYDPYNPTADVQVSMEIDGTILVAASTDGERPDVDAALHIGSSHGFTAPIPDSYFDGRRHELRLYMYNNATGKSIELQGSPMFFSAYDPGVEGVIDAISVENPQHYETFARGWAFDNNDTAKSVAVVAFADDYTTGKILGSTVADIARTDVDAAYGVGVYHGYAMPLDLTGYEAGELIHVSVYAVDLSVGELRLLTTRSYTVE